MMKHLQKPGVQMGLLAVVLAIAGAAFYISKQPGQPVNAPPPVVTKSGEVIEKTPETLALEDKKITLGEDRTARVGTDQQVERFVVPPKKAPPPSLITTSSSSDKKRKPRRLTRLWLTSRVPCPLPMRPRSPSSLPRAACCSKPRWSSRWTPLLWRRQCWHSSQKMFIGTVV